MLDVCILGNSGMQPLPDRHLSSAMFRYDGKSLLIDCGEGTQIAIKKKGWSIKSISVILLTHYHMDHIGGLPGLLASMANSEKIDELTIVGPYGLERVMSAVLKLVPRLPFRIKLVRLNEEYQSAVINGFDLEAFQVDHSSICYGFNVNVRRNGKFDFEKAEKNGIPEELWGPIQNGELVEYNGKILTKDLILSDTRKGIKVTYCTDSRPTDSIIRNATGADLFICEGMYGSDDDFENAVKNKHMLFSEAAEMAVKAGVKRLWLTHYSPILASPKIFLPATREIFKETYLTKCGQSEDLNFVKEE